jgi:hypothetical protein
MLAIASLLTVNAGAMAAPSALHHAGAAWSGRQVPYNARAEAPLRYDPSTSSFEPIYSGGELLFDRAKGNIE